MNSILFLEIDIVAEVLNFHFIRQHNRIVCARLNFLASFLIYSLQQVYKSSLLSGFQGRV